MIQARRACALVLAAVAVAALPARAAYAHALLRSSDPANGAVVASSPSQVTLSFTEPPDPKLSIVHVLDVSGHRVETGSTEKAGEKTLAIHVGALPKGVYTVSWRVVSRADSHVTAGAFAFGVGVSPAGVVPGAAVILPKTPPPSPLAVAGRWGVYWGLALLLGGAAVGLAVFGGRLPLRDRALIVPWVLSAAGLVAVTFAERASIGVPLRTLLSSGSGRAILREFIGLGVTAIALGTLLLVRRRWGLIALALAAGFALLMHALAGHAAAGGGRILNISIQWLHLVSVAVWIGGLAWLLAGLRGRDDTTDRMEAIGRYSRLAGYSLAVVVATGVVRAIGEVGSVGRLFSTSFGITLIIKMAAFVPLVGLGALNRYRLIPAMHAGDTRAKPFVRTLTAEVSLAALLFAVTGVLVGLPPASLVSAASKSPPNGIIVTGNDFGTSVRVRLTVTPGGAGPNRFEAKVSDYDSGVAVAARRVSLRFTLPSRPEVGASQLELARGVDGVWRGSGPNLSIRGRWHIDVLVEVQSGSVVVPLDMQTKAPLARLSVQPGSGPGQPTLYTLTFEDNSSLQVYADPEHPGRDEVHFTFFTASGNELPVPKITISATSPGGATTTPSLTRLSAGHVGAFIVLTAGDWRFDVDGTTGVGATVSASLTIPIKP